MQKFDKGLSRRRFIKRGSAAAAAATLATPLYVSSSEPAFAAYPDRPVRIIVANSPGGPSDVIARQIAPALQEAMGGSFIVENVGGGAGNIGMGRVARSDPDGYTLLLSTSSYAVNPGLFPSLPYDPEKDFAPIAELATSPNIFAIKADLGPKTLKEFVALASKNPDKFNIATPPVGTTPHLASEMLKSREGLEKMAVIFHTGGGAAIQALLSGSVQCYNGALSTAHAHIKAGTLIGLAVTGETRWHDLPAVPTMLDAGYQDFILDNYVALSAPAKTPTEVVKSLEKATLAALNNPTLKDRLLKSGFKVEARDGAAHMARIRREVPMYKQIISKAGIKLPQKQ
jgi:tripartite-type tricarboxylate transporter receptor subunit TctC